MIGVFQVHFGAGFNMMDKPHLAVYGIASLYYDPLQANDPWTEG
jgi:hypothetical protein